jgi:hypothetical protein
MAFFGAKEKGCGNKAKIGPIRTRSRFEEISFFVQVRNVERQNVEIQNVGLKM